MSKIVSPVAGYSGTGPQGLKFDNGVAHTDDPALIAYFERRGYGVDGSTPIPAGLGSPVQPDSRDIPAIEHGAPLRDAAIEPSAADFLPPVNAGKEDPHGPKVVAPGIHGAPDSPLVPGPVIDDKQEQQEMAAAQAILVDGEPHDMSEDALAPADAAPANEELSSPEETAATVDAERPARSAKVDDWRDYARTVNPAAADDIAGMTKAQLIAAYGDDTDNG